MRFHFLPLALLALSGPAMAQHGGPGPAQPYADLDNRIVSSLSLEELDGLRAGQGLSLALPAELNGYPGPVHVLELAARLMLTPEQTGRTRELVAAMRAETIGLGHAVITAETRLDLSFRERRATADSIERETQAAGAARATLRAAHLRYHLVMAALLTEPQMALYRSARGYRAP